MGAWGYKAFQNDGSRDWYDDNIQSIFLDVIKAPLKTDDGNWIEYNVTHLRATAEIMATMLSKYGLGVTDILSIRDRIQFLKDEGYHQTSGWRDPKKAKTALDQLLRKLNKLCDKNNKILI